MNEPATLTTPWRSFILAPGVGRASLRAGRHRLRAPRWCAPFQREYGGDYRGCDRSSESDLPEYLRSYIVTPSGSLRRYFLILALVQRSDSESSGQRSKTFAPPHPPLVVWRGGAGGAWSGGPGVGVRCGNGLFSTHKTPNFILASLSYCGSYLRYFIYLIPTK